MSTSQNIPRTLRLSIVEDHSLFLAGIQSLLERFTGIEVISTFTDGESVLLSPPEADIILLDIRLPGINGFEVLKTLKQQSHPAAILFLTSYHHKLIVSRAKQFGASGLILKDDAVKDLRSALLSLTETDTFYTSSSLAGIDITRVKQLTPREEQVLAAIGNGHTNKEISGLLEISVTTVNTYRSHLMLKLEASNTADLTRIAHEIGIL